MQENEMGIKENAIKILNDTIIKEISDAVSYLEYGTITIKVHDTKIVQIETAEKKR